MLVCSFLSLLPLHVVSNAPQVMNHGGVPYKISNPPGSTKNWNGEPGTYSTNFFTNAGGPVEYFDVYGEVQTKYSQVYWTQNKPINLPPQLVERFKGKVMAITGYEIDQVYHPGPQPGSTTNGSILGGFSCYPSCDAGDQSVPSYNAYNHHYFSWLVGKDAEVYTRNKPIHVPNPTWTGVRDLYNDHGFPTNIVFKENPGGEYRKSYHGYPAGYAQLIHSPYQWLVEPMQIDTHNRKYNMTEEVGYKPWFLPKQSSTSITEKNGLSPLIECPCTDRITRSKVNRSQILTDGSCSASVSSAAACTAAVEAVAKMSSFQTVHNASMPAGCIMVPDASLSYKAIFNQARDSQSCAFDKGPFTWKGPVNATVINCADDEACLPNDSSHGCTGEDQNQCTWESPEAAQSHCDRWQECEGFFCSTRYNKAHKLLCYGRRTGKTAVGQPADQSWSKAYARQQKLGGKAESLVNLTIDHDGDVAKITMIGPANAWFGVGFSASSMADQPYAIIVEGDAKVSERKLANHNPGTLLSSSITVLSTTTNDGMTTVELSRKVVGATKDHFSFPTAPGAIQLITAVGNTATLSYHKARTDAIITLLPSEVASCVCAPQEFDYFTYMNESTQQFKMTCADEPRSDMLRHGDGTMRNLPNQACHMETYHGGLKCCLHHFFLTDLDQNDMIPDQTDTYFLKWRYYFQEYVPAQPAKPASHRHLHHWVFLIDQAVNDYEEDNAEYGKASLGVIHAHLKARDMGLEDIPKAYNKITPLVMTPHCHAPSCIREELWNADTNEIICNVTAEYGSLEYGALSEHFNEASYVAIPPCIFGYQPGLQKPFSIDPNTNLTAIKYFNNTYRHMGQMAQWTGLMVYDTLSHPYIFV